MGIYDLKLEDKYITGSVHSLVAALQVTSMCSDNHVNSLSSWSFPWCLRALRNKKTLSMTYYIKSIFKVTIYKGSFLLVILFWYYLLWELRLYVGSDLAMGTPLFMPKIKWKIYTVQHYLQPTISLWWQFNFLSPSRLVFSWSILLLQVRIFRVTRATYE